MRQSRVNQPAGQPDTARPAGRVAGDVVVGMVSARDGSLSIEGRKVEASGDDLLDVRRVAAYLGISEGTWRSYVARGQAPRADVADADRPAGRRWPRWKLSTVERWDASRKGRGNHTSRLDGTR